MSKAESAKKVCEEDLQFRLEHKHNFVALEPSSRSFFLGKTFLEVALAAKKKFPDRKSFVIRIGHEAAFHIGDFQWPRLRWNRLFVGHGCGIPRSRQIFRAKKSLISRCRGTALVCSLDGLM